MDKPKIQLKRVDADTYELSIPVPGVKEVHLIYLSEASLGTYFTQTTRNMIKELQVGQSMPAFRMVLKIDNFAAWVFAAQGWGNDI
jgi:hypothetical protein